MFMCKVRSLPKSGARESYFTQVGSCFTLWWYSHTHKYWIRITIVKPVEVLDQIVNYDWKKFYINSWEGIMKLFTAVINFVVY